jgi:hypothetical protein
VIVQADTQEAQDMTLAKDAAETLHAHYPGHLWAVTVQGGCMVIKNLFLSSLYGMVLHVKNITDAAIRKKRVIRAGGELLERANLKRGSYTGEEVKSVEGVRGAR